MPKSFTKYLTKPSDEALDFLLKYCGSDKDSIFKDTKDFLNDRSNFILLTYEFKKLSAVSFFSADEFGRKIECVKIYSDKKETITSLINVLSGKFLGYKISFNMNLLDKKFLSEVKKIANEINDDNTVFTIVLGG